MVGSCRPKSTPSTSIAPLCANSPIELDVAGTPNCCKAIDKAIKFQLDLLDDAHPELAQHFRTPEVLKFGKWLRYSPETEIKWKTTESQ